MNRWRPTACAPHPPGPPGRARREHDRRARGASRRHGRRTARPTWLQRRALPHIEHEVGSGIAPVTRLLEAGIARRPRHRRRREQQPRRPFPGNATRGPAGQGRKPGRWRPSRAPCVGNGHDRRCTGARHGSTDRFDHAGQAGRSVRRRPRWSSYATMLRPRLPPRVFGGSRTRHTCMGKWRTPREQRRSAVAYSRQRIAQDRSAMAH